MRYGIRMSTPPMPFGLFAGVGLVGCGATTDVEIVGEPRTRTRPDMEWLLELIAELERDPEVRACLMLMANPAAVRNGGRLFHAVTSERDASVRATSTVLQVLELDRRPIARTALAAAMRDRPGATPESRNADRRAVAPGFPFCRAAPTTDR
jgi:lantibiotic biosynthesis protein